MGMVVWLRHEDRGVGHALMAGAAGDRVRGLAVAQLRQEFGVEVVGHADHGTGCLLDRVCVGGEVIALGLGILGVAEFAFDAEVAFIPVHELHDIVAGNV